jgi:L-amino acid N-acyltransferase YncA
VRRIYAEGIATGDATFETTLPDRRELDRAWLPAHRWVAERDGHVVGWSAIRPVSTRDVYAGVGETSIYVADGHRGHSVGKALSSTARSPPQTRQAIRPVDPANRDLPREPGQHRPHHSAGYRTLGIRERIGQHHGHWRDTVFLERRAAADPN